MSSQTIRERIIEALRVRLENYPWQTIGPNVFAGRTQFDPKAYPDRDELPIVTVVAGLEDSSSERYGIDRITMPVDISALVNLGDVTVITEECEPIFGEMRKAIHSGGEISLTVDGETQYFPIEYQGGGIATYPDELGPATITLVVTCNIIYATKIGDPYN